MRKFFRISHEITLAGLIRETVKKYNPCEPPRMTPEMVQRRISQDHRKNYPLEDITEIMESQASFGVLKTETYCDHVCYGF